LPYELAVMLFVEAISVCGMATIGDAPGAVCWAGAGLYCGAGATSGSPFAKGCCGRFIVFDAIPCEAYPPVGICCESGKGAPQFGAHVGQHGHGAHVGHGGFKYVCVQGT
jgi:hypothetical protein